MTKIALFPARFLLTAREARVAPIAEAVASFLATERDGPIARLVGRALGWRTTTIRDRAEARQLCAEGMKPLYLRFIDDYIPRVRDHGEPSLAESMLRWRTVLA